MRQKTKRLALVGTTAASMLNFRRVFITQLVQKGWIVSAFCCDYTDETKAAIRDLGANPVPYYAARTGMNPFTDLYTLYDLYRLFIQHKPDRVLSYFAKPVIYATLAAKGAGVSRVFGMLEGLGYAFTLIPGESPSLRARLLKAIQVCLYRCALPLLDGLVLLNTQDKHELCVTHKIRVKKCLILGGIGVDLRVFNYHEPSNAPFTFLFVGRLLREKGIHLFVNAAKRLKEKHPDVHFVVAGGGDSNPGGLTPHEITQMSANKTITFCGHVADMPRLYKDAHVFVLPSYREGYSLSVQEAMASGRPVITSDAPGCQGTVHHGKTGLTHINGSVESLYTCMKMYVDKPALARDHGRNAHNYAKNNLFVLNKTILLIDFIDY